MLSILFLFGFDNLLHGWLITIVSIIKVCNYGFGCFGCFWIDLNSLPIVLLVTSGDVMQLLLNPDLVHVMYAKHQGSIIN